MRLHFVAATLMLAASACSPPAQTADTPNSAVEQEQDEAPAEVLALIAADAADFNVSEIIADDTAGAQAYEVSGTAAGAARTYIVMQQPSGWHVVSIRRDIAWTDAPQSVRAVAPNAATPVRVVEVREPGADGVIYELYAVGAPDTPVYVREVDGEAAIMPPAH